VNFFANAEAESGNSGWQNNSPPPRAYNAKIPRSSARLSDTCRPVNILTRARNNPAANSSSASKMIAEACVALTSGGKSKASVIYLARQTCRKFNAALVCCAKQLIPEQRVPRKSDGCAIARRGQRILVFGVKGNSFLIAKLLFTNCSKIVKI
jgi:hypothetical protein